MKQPGATESLLYYLLNTVAGCHLPFLLCIRHIGGSYVRSWQSLIAFTFHMNAFRCVVLEGLWSYCQGVNCVSVKALKTRSLASVVVNTHRRLPYLFQAPKSKCSRAQAVLLSIQIGVFAKWWPLYHPDIIVFATIQTGFLTTQHRRCFNPFAPKHFVYFYPFLAI